MKRGDKQNVRAESAAIVGRCIGIILSRLAGDPAGLHPEWLAYLDRLAEALVIHYQVVGALVSDKRLRAKPPADAASALEPTILRSAAGRAKVEAQWGGAADGDVGRVELCW